METLVCKLQSISLDYTLESFIVNFYDDCLTKNKFGENVLALLFVAFTPIDSSDFRNEEGEYSAQDHDSG